MGALATMAALASLTQGAIAQDAAAKQAIQAQYSKFVAALKRKDTKTMMALLTPDFTSKLPGGQTMNRQQFEANLASLMAPGETIQSASAVVQKLTPGKGVTYADVKMHLEATL